MKAQRSGYRIMAAALAAATIAGLCGTAHANIYPSGVTINAASFNDLTGTARIGYILNENADGDGTNPGVLIEVLDGTSTPVRTVSIARQLKGSHEFEWDGRDDDGNRVTNASYTVRITASDYGYTSWTRISDEATSNLTHFERPLGVSVNKNPASPNYGKIYVSQASNLTTASGRAMQDGIYMLYADGSDAGFADGGLNWTTGDANHVSPFKSTIGPDDHLYVAKFNQDLAFEFSGDMTSVTQLIDASNKTASQYVESILVEGTQAGGNRKIYLSDSNYYAGAFGRKGMIMYNLGGNATATPGDTGTQYIGPNYFSYYPREFARDSNGDWYCCQYRYTPGQAPPVSKFLDGTPPLNTPEWEASDAYTGAYGIDLYEPKNWVAYGDYYSGYVHIFDTTTGAFVTEFGAGSRIREVAFDAVGNIYTVDNLAERLRIWSPPDEANWNALETSAVALNKSGSGGPVISDHPADAAVCPGDNASFSVTAAVGPNPIYQWKKNGVNIGGANSATLQLTGVQAADDGSVYTCVITDQNGVAVSNPATLTVGIVFSQIPLATKVCQNSNATFTATVTLPGASYQWQRTTPPDTTIYNDIPGATNPTLVLPVTAADDGTRVRCHVTAGACPAVDSPYAVVTVSSGPAIGNVATSYVTPNPRPSGSGATFYAVLVSATGSTSHQWKRDGVALVDGEYPWGIVTGAATPDLVVTELTCAASGSFTVAITDDCGTTESVCTHTPGTPGQSCYLTVGGAVETCNNGVDDDCDGLVDCDDSDCDADPFCGPSCNAPFADWDLDTDVDSVDFSYLQNCLDYTGLAMKEECQCFDRDNDGDIDPDDVAAFVACGSGPDVPADPACDDRPSGLGKVVINEVAYDMVNQAGAEITDELEFVELYNRSAETVDISGWILKASDIAGDNNRDFMVPGGVGSGTTLLAPGGYFVFTSPNVPVPPPNPPALDWLEVPSPTDIWENGPDALELLDANQTVVDTVIYGRNVDPALNLAAPGEGRVWGSMRTVAAGREQSLSRWLDGLDTNNNGRDFGLRVWTPGTSNQGTASVVASYTLADVNLLGAGENAPGLDPSFQPAVVIDPTVDTTVYPNTSFVVNPNPIPTASPQGGNAVVVWDFAEGGGNMAVSRNLMNNAGGFDLYVYLDTSFAAWGTNTGYESTSYGVMGTTDTAYYGADPDANVFGDVITANGNTGLAWVFNKIKGTSNICKLFLVDAGPGGDSSPGTLNPGTWTILAEIDMLARPSGWYRLSISYNGALTTNNVTASAGGTNYGPFTTAQNLAGGFYVGYRESTPADPGVTPVTYLRPATFDTAP